VKAPRERLRASVCGAHLRVCLCVCARLCAFAMEAHRRAGVRQVTLKALPDEWFCQVPRAPVKNLVDILRNARICRMIDILRSDMLGYARICSDM
jgi:hypothetical protein